MHAARQADQTGCPPLAGILLALGIVLVALTMQALPSLADHFQWQRGRENGVTMLTSHLCHWSWNHIVWDLLAFVVLSLLSLRLMPSRYGICMLVAAVLITLEVKMNQPLLTAYRGLSGVDTALLGLVIAALWWQPSSDRTGMSPRLLALLGGCGFIAKTLYEMITGGNVFVEVGQDPFVPVVSSHLVGFISGLAVGSFRMWMRPVLNKS
ncbi:rhomboid family intramembrane serine protease [Prosthecobacter sp.]|uniref:rhomboid family intramembrane serine protease n=1 Tax=Prosthecobacter sp. TaxID=1965333 RepID=UPI003784B928